MGAGDALQHYDAVGEAVTEAISGTSVGRDLEAEWQRPETTRDVESDDGQCLYTPGDWYLEPEPSKWDADEVMEELADAVEPVLDEYGFSTEDPDREGGLVYIRGSDEHGAQIAIDSHGAVQITDAVVDAQPCTAEAIGFTTE